MEADATILVVDDDAVSRHVLTEALEGAGLRVICADSGVAALEWLEESTPSVVLLDLLMPELDGYEILSRLREHPKHHDIPVVVLTALDSDDDIERIFESGADDYVRKPFRNAELIARLRGQMRVRAYLSDLNRRQQTSQTVLELSHALASSLDIRDILFTVVQRVATVAQVDRCSIVLARPGEEVAYVVASSDDEQLKDLPIELEKYPEIREALTTGRALVLPDARRHPLLEAIATQEPIEFDSVALIPILHEEKPLGVLFLRSRQRWAVGEHELELVTTIAHTTAIALRNARLLQSLRDQTQQSTFARVEAERRLQLFQRYADFFESSADGMVVIDRQGHVLLTNPKAREITGFSESELVGARLPELLTPQEQERAERLLRGFKDGIYPQGVDIVLRARAGEELTLNLSFSSVLHEDDAVLFTLRDVTRERRTAVELMHTKEFLELVIESSPDAIVSADTKGSVLLFNRAASRIFGYRPEDVVGKVSVELFYPPGVAREVMKGIRAAEYGGRGRLDDFRVDMIGSQGETIPVKLSAALISSTQSNRPMGSVGIFTDIRERLRMEARLNKAQEELRNREKQAIVAELAGTAAHELNQPLTSVIGYAELLRRHLDTESQLANAAGIIITEAERMAEIVRKIGKITKYETKSYVGGQKILDLDKSSEEPSGERSGL